MNEGERGCVGGGRGREGVDRWEEEGEGWEEGGEGRGRRGEEGAEGRGAVRMLYISLEVVSDKTAVSMNMRGRWERRSGRIWRRKKRWMMYIM